MFLISFYQNLLLAKRLNHILLVFLKAGFFYYLDRIGLGKKLKLRRLGQNAVPASRLPANLRLSLERLGPVFVKFGQILSTRWDLLPEEYILELEKLQSHVAPFPFKQAKKTIESTLKKPLDKAFKAFSVEPFASASLGQVYRATLHDGKEVAVKVQRPGMKKQILLDTKALLFLANFLEHRMLTLRDYNLIGVVKEFRRWTLNELDYRKEAANCEVFANYFINDPHIYSPKVYWDYSSESVLTLELVKGKSLKSVINDQDIPSASKKEVAKRCADSFVRQYFEYGFFHADPHPGNIFVLKNNVLMFLDFGMVGWLDQKLTALAAAAFLAIVQKDVEKLVQLLVKVEEDYDDKLGTMPVKQKVNINSLRKDLNELLSQWTEKSGAGKFTRLFYSVLNVAVKNGVGVPIDLIMLSKSIITLDAVINELHPELKLEEWEGKMVEKIYLEKLKPKRIKEAIEHNALMLESILSKLPESTERLIKRLENDPGSATLNPAQIDAYEALIIQNNRMKNQLSAIILIILVSLWIENANEPALLFGWPLSRIGLIFGFMMILLFFYSNINKHKNYEKID